MKVKKISKLDIPVIPEFLVLEMNNAKYKILNHSIQLLFIYKKYIEIFGSIKYSM